MPAKKPAKTTPDRPQTPVTAESYPTAPTNPVERREWARRRNARISGLDENEYLETLTAQDKRVGQHVNEQRPQPKPK